MPLIVGVVLPIIFIFALGTQARSTLTRAQFISAANSVANTGSTYFVIIPVVLPSIMGSYSIVGEKIEKSLEPLLATPTTDGELLLGKSLATFLPTHRRNLHRRSDIHSNHGCLVLHQTGDFLASQRRFSSNTGS